MGNELKNKRKPQQMFCGNKQIVLDTKLLDNRPCLSSVCLLIIFFFGGGLTQKDEPKMNKTTPEQVSGRTMTR